MIRGLYMANTGMVVQELKSRVLAANLANLNTPGYKRDAVSQVSFPEVLMMRIGGGSNSQYIGTLPWGTAVGDELTVLEPGSMVETGRELDLAIDGTGFFVVETPQGERLTRQGRFWVDSEGYLVDGRGNYVLGSTGRIHVGSGVVEIGAGGEVRVDGREVDRVFVALPPGGIRKVGDNLFASAGALEEAPGAEIRAGYLETSNVEAVEELIAGMQAFRAYQSSRQVLVSLNEVLGRTVNEVGSLR